MTYRFDAFELDTEKFELRKSGAVVPIEPQPFLVLKYLIENRDRLVTRNDLIDAIWGGRAVSDWVVSAAIKSVRIALSDTANPRRFVRTVHGQGFRFIGSVSALSSKQTGQPGPDTKSPSLVVLPFENLSGDPEQDYFADGISEDLITDMSRISNLSILSRNASFAFKKQSADMQTVAARFKIDHVLEGSVRRSGAALRINVQLVEAATGVQKWAERFEGTGTDVFALQDRINARIISALNLRLSDAIARRGTQNPEAYDLCLRGRSEYYLYSPAHLAKALEFFEQAAAIDPDYAEAYAYQSYCRTSNHVFAWPGSDATLDPAIALARRAVELDPASAVARARLGWVLGFVNRPKEAESSFDQGIEYDPANAEVYYAYGETMNRLCEPERAVPLLAKAFSLDSFVPPAWEFAKGHSCVLMKNHDGALSHIKSVLERVPRFIPGRVQLARVYAEMGQTAKAEDTIKKLREFAPRYRLLNAKRMFPYPDPDERDRLETALRSAGLQDASDL